MQRRLSLASFLLILLLLGMLFSSCKKKDAVGAIGVNSGIGVYYTDTFSVNLSTILLDSLPTSTSSRLLSGKLNLGNPGSLTASSYFQLSLKGNDTDGDGIEDILDYTGTPIYDSLVLLLEPTYSYGDEEAIHNMSVYRLSQNINYPSGTSYLFNSSYFTYNSSPLGNKSFVLTTDMTEVRITMNENFGNELFDLAKAKDSRVSTNAIFKDYFKGLVLVSNGSNNSVYGYNPNPIMRLYYHDSDVPQSSKTYDFAYNSTYDVYFNRIINDRSSTALNGLQEQYQEVHSTQTNNESYLLTGIDLMPKISFPTLQNLKSQFPYMMVNTAQLIIHPKENTYDKNFYLPENLVLYATNISNQPYSIITYFNSGSAQFVSPSVDWESNELTYYTFDVTDFVIKQIETSGYSDAALLLGSLKSESAERTEKLILENNQKYSVKLKLYFTNFTP